jgi:formate hydrogenlyase subunit 6/NADH:ubiquinone oxidoreductase subunit I
MFDMIGNVMSNMVTKPATRKYPFVKRPSFSRTRGHIEIDIDKCIFCGMCSRKCPSTALTVNKAEKSWEIDPFKCIICNECVGVCPKKCIIGCEEYTTSALEKGKRKYVQESQPAAEPVKEPEKQEKKIIA